MLPPPPAPKPDTSLFFDLDGTLIEIADRPDRVIVDDDLLGLLRGLARCLPGRLAIVSGRSVAQLDGLLGEVARTVTVAGSHGAEIREADGEIAPAARPAGIDIATRHFADLAAGDEGLIVEHKTLGTALHYRLSPARAEEAEALATGLATAHGLVLQRGKMMVELRAPGDKGAAIRHLIEAEAMRGTTPLMFGDDVTDEDGFRAAAALGGAGVLVGVPRATVARYGLTDVPALRLWMRDAVEFCR